MFRKSTKRQKVEDLHTESGQEVKVQMSRAAKPRGTRNEWSTLTTPWQQGTSASDIRQLRTEHTVVSLDPDQANLYSDEDDLQVKREVDSLSNLRPREAVQRGVSLSGPKEQPEEFVAVSSDEETVREWTESQMRSGTLWRQSLSTQLPVSTRQDATLSDFLSDIAHLTQSTMSEVAASQERLQQLEQLEARSNQKIEALTQTSLSHTETFVMFEEFKDYVETLLECMEDCKAAVELAVKRIEGQEVLEAAARRHFRLTKWCAACQETLPMWQSTPPPAAPHLTKYEDVIEELFSDALEKYYDWKYIVRSFNTVRTALPHLAAELDCDQLLHKCVVSLAKLETWTWSPFRQGWDLQTLIWYTHLSGWPKVRESIRNEVLVPRADFAIMQCLDLYDHSSVLRGVEGAEFLRKQALWTLVKEQVEDLSAPSTEAGCICIASVCTTVLAGIATLAPFLPSDSVQALIAQIVSGVYLSCLQEMPDAQVQASYQQLLDILKPFEYLQSILRPVLAWVRFERPSLMASLS